MHWKALTDHQASLSIASLGVDVTDPSGKTLIAGIGLTSNSTVPWPGGNGPGTAGRGGPLTGLLYSTDGGDTWKEMGNKSPSQGGLNGMSVGGVAARGSTILAATFETKDPSNQSPSYGLYVSTDTGKTFSLMSSLPPGPVTSLVADPANSNVFYAAVTAARGPRYNQTALYRGVLAGGQWTWTKCSMRPTATIRSPAVIKPSCGWPRARTGRLRSAYWPLA
jgi:hypothetical protein